MVYIFDITSAEQDEALLKSGYLTDEDFNEDCTEAFYDIDTATEDLLKRYYELVCCYGDPIENLLTYISEDDKRKILRDFNYLIGDSVDDARKKYDEYVAAGLQPIG